MRRRTNNRPAMYFAMASAILYAVVSGHHWVAFVAYAWTIAHVEAEIFTKARDKETGE